VTITASTNLNEDEIKKAVRDAEQFANEDKKRKEEVETRNHADSLVYSTEKTLKDLGDKIPAADKARVEEEISAVKKVLEGTDSEALKKATEKLTEVSYDVFGKIYQQAQQQGQGQQQQYSQKQGGGAQPNDNVVDADYEVVDDNDKK
jgi:molecular chaperone DnaK